MELLHGLPKYGPFSGISLIQVSEAIPDGCLHTEVHDGPGVEIMVIGDPRHVWVDPCGEHVLLVNKAFVPGVAGVSGVVNIRDQGHTTFAIGVNNGVVVYDHIPDDQTAPANCDQPFRVLICHPANVAIERPILA